MNKFTSLALISTTIFAISNTAFATATPQQISTLAHQADDERARGQMEQAVKDYEQVREMTLEVIKENPNSAKAYYYLAQVDSRLGRKEEAKQAINKAHALDPNQNFKSSTQKKELEKMFNQ